MAEQVAERRTADRIFGAVGVAMLVLALIYFIRSFGEGGSDTGAAPAGAAIPTLAILSPAAGAELAQPAAVEFDAGAPLTLGPTGWTAEGRHLHLFAGPTELMAGSGELRHLGGTRYRWTLPALPAGETTLRLAWSDETHRTMPQGASPPVSVRLR